MNSSADRANSLFMSGNLAYAEYFDAVYHAWLSAAPTTGGEVNKYIKINGFTIRLAFCGQGMIPGIMPALEHLEYHQARDVDLAIFLWDSRTAHTKLPDIPWKISEKTIPGEIWTYDDEFLTIVYNPSNETILLLNKSTNIGIYWVRDSSAIPYHDQASPLRLIFQRWMRTRQFQVVHAGAVGLPEGGILLAGKGGSGKSTTSLSCLNSELLYAGDDYCLLADHSEPYVYSLYNTGKLNVQDIDRFPSLKPALYEKWQVVGEKALYFFHRYFPLKMSTGFPVHAILIPEITGRVSTKLKRVSPAKGFLALAPTTIYQVPKADQSEANHNLDRFVRKVPNYILEVGSDLSQIPKLIIDLLRSVKNE
jgi:hypothetical protein